MLNDGENNTARAEQIGSAQTQKEMSKNATIAAHLEQAIKHHHNAVKFHENGNPELAHKDSIFALGHCCLARELLREGVKGYSENMDVQVF